jgi:hypothetical protein
MPTDGAFHDVGARVHCALQLVRHVDLANYCDCSERERIVRNVTPSHGPKTGPAGFPRLKPGNGFQ